MTERAKLLAALDHLRSAFTNRAHADRIILAADAAMVIEAALDAATASPEGGPTALKTPQETSERLALLEGVEIGPRFVDDFGGANAHLLNSTHALLWLHVEGGLTHPIPGLARQLLNNLAARLQSAEAQLSDLKAERGRLVEALEEAVDGWEDGYQYKGEYLATKHGDAEGVAKVRALLTELKNSSPSVAESTRKGPVALPETGSAEVGRGEA